MFLARLRPALGGHRSSAYQKLLLGPGKRLLFSLRLRLDVLASPAPADPRPEVVVLVGPVTVATCCVESI